MVVARASGMLMASSLKQNKFWVKLLLRWRNSARGCPPPRIVPHGRGTTEEFLDYCSGCGIPGLPPSSPLMVLKLTRWAVSAFDVRIRSRIRDRIPDPGPLDAQETFNLERDIVC